MSDSQRDGAPAEPQNTLRQLHHFDRLACTRDWMTEMTTPRSADSSVRPLHTYYRSCHLAHVTSAQLGGPHGREAEL